MRSNPKRPRGRVKELPMAAEREISNAKINEIAILLAKGVSQKQIRVQKSEEWGCTEQNVHYFIKKAMKAMQSSIEKRLDYVLAVQRERLEYILAGAIEKKDYQSAQKIIDTMNKLYGLYTEKKQVQLDVPTIQFKFGETITNNSEDEETNE